jgi:hypothetical protein
MKNLMPSDAGVAQLEDMFRGMVGTDGGIGDIQKLYKGTKLMVNGITKKMLEGLEHEYDTAKKDLKALDDAIDNSVRNITVTDLEEIKMKALAWCTKKRALETAIAKVEKSEIALADCLEAPLGLPHILVKEVTGLGEADCSKSQGTPRDGTCPPQWCTKNSRVAAKVDSVRQDYLRLSWLLSDRHEDKITAISNEGNSKGQFHDSVTRTARDYHSVCISDYKVHETAVKLFNTNNGVLASMYVSLGTIQCHINHMKSGEEFDIEPKLLKPGQSGTSRNAGSCISKLKSDASIETDLFPDASLSVKECPSLQAYEDIIYDYGNFGFHKNETIWSPTQKKCEAVTSHWSF